MFARKVLMNDRALRRQIEALEAEYASALLACPARQQSELGNIGRRLAALKARLQCEETGQ